MAKVSQFGFGFRVTALLGVMTTPDWKFIGFFKNGLYHGRGRKEFTLGAVYEGNFTHGVLNGKGSDTSHVGPVISYTGILLHIPRTDKEIGEYVNGVRQGNGELLYSSGDRYVGQVVNGNVCTALLSFSRTSHMATESIF